MRGKTTEDFRLLDILDPIVKTDGYHIVRLRFMTSVRGSSLQVFAETENGQMTIDACANLSRKISATLENHGKPLGSYSLEVSSPGIDRPLTRPEDFVTYQGFEVALDLKSPIEGRRRWKGRIENLEKECVFLQSPDTEEILEIPFAAMTSAKLVITAQLLEMGEKRLRQQDQEQDNNAQLDTGFIENGHDEQRHEVERVKP